MSENAAATTKTVRVWDLPLRLFHWSLAVLVIANIVLANIGGSFADALTWHARLGYAVLALLFFRIVWGFIGGTHARFLSFIRGPGQIIAYLKGQAAHTPGHNPLGALSVLALITSTLFQAVSGLFLYNEDLFFEAPLYKYASGDLVESLTSWHILNSKILIALVILHVLALLFYRFVKRETLFGPMFTGKRNYPADATVSDAQGGSFWLGAISLAVCAGSVWYVVTQL